MDGAKAKYLAEAGINDAISLLRADAKLKFDYSDSNISINGVEQFLDGVSSYTVVIEDEQRKVNLDDANRNLLRSLLGDGDYTRADAIIAAYPLVTKEQIRQVAGIDDAAYQSNSRH